MPDDIEAAYDAFAYPSGAIVDTHPRRLATLAMLYGMAPAQPARCRVLELGCGAGENLIGMAFVAPHSEFVGIDISGRSIEEGKRLAAEMGLANVDLRHCDIMQVGADFGTFDYIVAHGVYSWVPVAVREKVLAILKAHLAPEGIGYLSYNAYPGAHLRDVARDILRFHTRDLDPHGAVEAGLAIVKAIGEANTGESGLYGAVLREQSEELAQRSAQVIHHDDLSSAFSPFLLHEVVAAADRHDLQYVCDANFGYAQVTSLSKAGRKIVEGIPNDRQVEREQYIDFIVGRSFRRSLLCHKDVTLRRDVSHDKVRGCFVAGKFSLVGDAAVDPLAPGPIEIEGPAGTLQTDSASVKTAFLHLGAIWPESIAFDDLAQLTTGSMLRAGLIHEGDVARRTESLAAVVFLAYGADQLDLSCEPLPLTIAISERPQASALARKQAERRSSVSNLRHSAVKLENALVRHFLCLVDGTRTVEELLAEFNTALERSRPQGAPLARATRDQVMKNLNDMARLGLLAR